MSSTRLSVGFVFAVALLSLLLIPLSGSVQARPLDEVVDSGEVSIFVYSDYAPYSWKEGDNYRGIDVELAYEIGKELGVDVNILMRGADENVDDDLRINIWKGDLIHGVYADIMLHVPVDREVDIRNEFVVIQAPYFQEQMAIVVDSDKLPEVKTFGRFVSTPIAVELDTAGDFFLSNAFRGQLHQSIRRGRTFADAVAIFINGETPALMASRAQTEWVSSQAENRSTRIVQPPMPGIVRLGWPIGIAVKHDSRDLGYAVGDALDSLAASGKLERIFARYGVNYMKPEM